MAFLAVEQARLLGKRRLDGVGTDAIDRLHDSNLRFDRAQAMPGPGNSIIVKNVPRSTNADVWDEFADEDEDDDFLSPEMRERLKALDAETAPPVDKCPIQHDLGDEDALKCSKDWVNAIVSDAGICPFSLSADRAGLPLAVHKSKFHGAFVLNRRVDLRAIDATLARWRDAAGSSPVDGASTAASSPRNDVHPTH